MPTRFRRFASLVLTLSLAAGGSWADSVRVEAARVNVRKDPNTASAIVTTVGRGEALEVIERSGDWYHVKTAAGVEGYVSARLVAPVTPAATSKKPVLEQAADENGAAIGTHNPISRSISIESA